MKQKKHAKSSRRIVATFFLMMLVGLGASAPVNSQADTVKLVENNKKAQLPDSIRVELTKKQSQQGRLIYLLEEIEQVFLDDDTLSKVLIKLADEYVQEDELLAENAKLLYWKIRQKVEGGVANEELSLLAKQLESVLLVFDQRRLAFWKGRTLALFSQAYYYMDDYTEAVRYNDESLSVLRDLSFEQEKEYALYGDIYRVRGNILYMQDDLDSMQHYYRLARNAYQIAPKKNKKKIILILINEGVMWGNEEEFMRADTMYRKAEELSIQYDSLLLGDVYLEWGITLGGQASETGQEHMFARSDQKLRQSLIFEETSKARAYYQVGANFQNKAKYLFQSDDNDKEFFSSLDSAAYYYRAATTAAVTEQRKWVIDEVNEQTAKICDFIPVEKCTEILSTIGGTYQEIYKLKEEESKQKEKAQESLNELEQKIIQQRNQRNLMLITLGSLTIFGFIILLSRYRIQKQKFENLQKAFKLRMEASKAQMNPHFISNALNAIDSLVNQKRNKEASQYIVYFSRLCRMILDGSKREFIPLQKEVNILKYFLSIEQLRLAQGRLTVYWDIDDALELEHAYVPPLILQPIVENAIWHGILNKEDGAPGTLSIAIAKKNDLIECTIEDDGVGRKQARAMRKESKWQSYGTVITNERIEALKNLKDSSMETIDLIENGVALGTRVIISLPILSKPEEYAN